MNLGILSLLVPALGAVPEPPLPPAPVLYVKVLAPEGARVTFHPGSPLERGFDAPVTVALRPGYRYRLRLDEPAAADGRAFFPTLEVRGSLHPPPGMNIADYPVPVVITAEDLRRARAGGMVSKVLYLEDPRQAVPLPTEADDPIEFPANSEGEAVHEARLRGRLVLIFRVGEKEYTPEELAPKAIDGTILFPGEPALAPPAAPPHFQAHVYPPFDPIAGPLPTPEECLHDGGDIGQRLGIGVGGRLHGLDPSDTAVEFTTPDGRRVATSNRVCVCVPRFVALRAELLPVGIHTLVGPQREQILRGPDLLAVRQPPRLVELLVGPEVAKGRLALWAMTGAQGLHALELIQGPRAVAQYQGAEVVADYIGTQEITSYPGCRLLLQKWGAPDPPHHIGQEITFYLRYTNVTPEPMRDVVVSDSLTARLEYVPGSARSDREATFTYTPNEAGSVLLR
ncbi:MAG TPA: hypothetical protein VIL46_18980, partial [Gemmataceae bacterium]